MKRLYVANLADFEAHRTSFNPLVTSHWLALVNTALSNYMASWEALGKPVLVSTNFAAEHFQDRWHANTNVTVLPHSGYQPTMTMAHVMQQDENSENSMDGVNHIINAGWGITTASTILDVHKAAAKHHHGYKHRMY